MCAPNQRYVPQTSWIRFVTVLSRTLIFVSGFQVFMLECPIYKQNVNRSNFQLLSLNFSLHRRPFPQLYCNIASLFSPPAPLSPLSPLTSTLTSHPSCQQLSFQRHVRSFCHWHSHPNTSDRFHLLVTQLSALPSALVCLLKGLPSSCSLVMCLANSLFLSTG